MPFESVKNIRKQKKNEPSLYSVHSDLKNTAVTILSFFFSTLNTHAYIKGRTCLAHMCSAFS